MHIDMCIGCIDMHIGNVHRECRHMHRHVHRVYRHAYRYVYRVYRHVYGMHIE